MMSDKEYFAQDWQKVILTHPDLFSVPAKRYIRSVMTKDANVNPDFKVSALELEILQFLSQNPSKAYLARDILIEVHAASETHTGNKIKALTGPLVSLKKYGYVSGNDLKPQSYQITVKGLKLLNKIINDYD